MKDLVTKDEVKSIKILTVFGYAAMSIILLGLLLFSYWSFQPTKVLVFNKSPIPVRVVGNDGERIVVMKADYCKKLSVTGRVRTSFLSASQEFFLPVSEDRQPEGCHDVEVPVLVPKTVTPGIYKIHFRVEYRINPIRTVVEEIDSAEFTIDTPR